MEVKSSEVTVNNLPDDLTSAKLKSLKIKELRGLSKTCGWTTKGVSKSKLLARLQKALTIRDSLKSMEESEEEPEEAEEAEETPAGDDEEMEEAGEEEADEEEEEAEAEAEADKAEEAEEPAFSVGDDYIEGVVFQWKGTYGFIDIGGSRKLFCHNAEIKSSDRVPCLRKNMEVRLKLATWTAGDKKGQTFAANVEARDGGEISYFEKQGETDHWNRETIEPVETYQGTVLWYNFRKKFGLIKPDEPISFGEGDDKVEISEKSGEGKDSVYVGWHDIITDDVPPGLVKDMKVQFTLYKDGQGFGAANVALVGGEPVVRPDARNKKWSPDTEARFTGKVKYFKVNGFGFVTPNEEQADGEKFPYTEQIFKERLYVNPYDIQTDSSPAFLEEGQEVEFSVDVGNGQLHAKNITAPGGESIPAPEAGKLPEAYSEKVKRESISDNVFTGKIKVFQWDKHFGFITLEEDDCEGLEDKQKEEIKEKSVYLNWSDIQSKDKIVGIEVGTEVKFKLYKDEKGIGAEAVTDADGNAFEGQVKPERKRRTFRGRGRGRGRGRRGRGRGRGRWKSKGRGRGRGRGRKGKGRGRGYKRRRNSGGRDGGNKRRRTMSWDDVSNRGGGGGGAGGTQQGFVQWWDKASGEGCIVAGRTKYKATKEQLQAEKDCWAFLEKDQMIEFQSGKDRFGHDCCFYITGPGGSLIRQLTTLTTASPQGGAVPPTQASAGGGSRFLSTGRSRWGGGW